MFSSKSELTLFVQKCFVVLLIAGGLLAMYTLRNLIGAALISALFVLILHPWLTRLENRKVPSWFSILLLLGGIGIFLALALIAALPIFAERLSELFMSIEVTLKALSEVARSGGSAAVATELIPAWLFDHIQPLIRSIPLDSIVVKLSESASQIGSFAVKALSSAMSGGASVLSGIAAGVVSGALVIILTIFFAIERRELTAAILRRLPTSFRRYIIERTPQTIGVLEAWTRSQLILALVIWVMTYAGLHLIDLVFSLGLTDHASLALIAGIMEFIPSVGPIIALIPALVMASGVSSNAAIAVVILYIVISQLENNLIVPYVMHKTVALSSSIIILAMLAGGMLSGVLGLFLAVPIACVISSLMKK